MFRALPRVIAFASLTISPGALAQAAVPTSLTLEAYEGGTYASAAYSKQMPLLATLTFPAPCPGPGQGYPTLAGTLTVKRDGVVVFSGVSFTRSIFRSCTNGVQTSWQFVGDYGGHSEPGDYTYTVEYTGEPGMAPSSSASVHLRIYPDRQEPLSANGPGTIGVSGGMAAGKAWSCPATPEYGASAPPSEPPPAGLRFPFGFASYRFSQCGYECGYLCPGGAPFGTHPQARVLIDTNALLPATASVWAYTAGTGDGPPTWQRLPAQVYGGRGAFDAMGKSSSIEGIAGIAIPDGTPALQDMWWAGQAENGWGITVSQNGEGLFLGFFIYDDAGRPEWLVMPNGSWDVDHGSFSGQLYRPTGSWFGNYQARSLVAGSPVGTAKLAFASGSRGALDLTLDGRTVHKSISRLPYAPQVQGTHDGLWWGGTLENGWGVAISQQDQTLFAVWFTYDIKGKGVWYVMPGGTWSGNVYTGALYRSEGSGWLGSYDAARLVATPVGSLSLRFSAADRADMTYVVDGVTGTEMLLRQPF